MLSILKVIMVLNLTLKDLQRSSPAKLSKLGQSLKEQFGVDLPPPESLFKSGEWTIQVVREDLSQYENTLTKAGIPIVVKSPDTSAFSNFFNGYTQGLQRCIDALNIEDLEEIIEDILRAREAKRTIYIFGNGGSASTASHFANDFSKDRFNRRDKLFKIICLNDCVPLMTALANDEGYENVFSSQLNNHLEPGDLVIAISSSGNSKNIIKALEVANERGAKTWSWVGFDGGEAQKVSKRHLYIPSKKGQYGFMEDITLVITHMLSVYLQEQDRAELK